MYHLVICSQNPVKNTNTISIFSCFLDTVVKPRYDTEVFFKSHTKLITKIFHIT
ncbi:palindromic element RPE4 domain-containing protein [Rickettsia sp. R2]